jgi:ribosome-associated toxin RatA of RatAB toxin-antitoxin module
VKSAISIDVGAPPELVFALARDVERWADLLPHYASVRVLSRDPGDGALDARFVARRPLLPVLGLAIPVAWRSRTWSEPSTLRLRFRHRGGATNGMDVTWRIERVAEGSRVTIEHDFRPRVPGWAALVDRLFTRPIAGRTLATFRAIAEAVAASDMLPRPASTTPDGANQPP